jgi:hypothetical protein
LTGHTLRLQLAASGWQVVCTCGTVGPVRADKKAARLDAGTHIANVGLRRSSPGGIYGPPRPNPSMPQEDDE